MKLFNPFLSMITKARQRIEVMYDLTTPPSDLVSEPEPEPTNAVVEDWWEVLSDAVEVGLREYFSPYYSETFYEKVTACVIRAVKADGWDVLPDFEGDNA
jgi:hypothetical protein